MKIRTTCPKNNKYYIRKVTGGLNGAVAGEPTQKYANVLDNCVGYANGRFNEIWNDPNLEGVAKTFHVQLTCNAENFIESAKKQGLKISSTPVIGGIMVWQKGATLKDKDGAGHVAVVERVYDDGTILTSESGWASWAFKTVRRDNSNGRWGQNSLYKFRGCIINPNIKNVITPAPKLAIDGVGGACTVRAMQRFFGTPMDGVLSGQKRAWNKYYPALEAVEYGSGGSACVKKLQQWVGVSQDGVIGEKTVKAWQKKIGVSADGVFGTNSMKTWQKYLNEHDKAVYPEPTFTDTILAACKEQAEWSKNSKYKWQKNPTVEKSKDYETCVTYAACVGQRVDIIPTTKYIWHNSKGKVVGATDNFEIIYPNKKLRDLKGVLKAGDFVMDGDKTDLESGSHIFIVTGEWKDGCPIVWDNHSAQQGKMAYKYTRNRPVIAIARPKAK